MSARTRTIIYAVLVGALGVASALGVITEGQSTALAEAGGAVLSLVAAVALVIATRHVTADTWGAVRAAAYTMVAAALAAATLFGLVDDTAPWLAGTDTALDLIGMVLLSVATAKVPAVEAAEVTEGAA